MLKNRATLQDLRFLLLAGLLILLVRDPAVAIGTPDDPCITAIPIAVNSHFRSLAYDEAQPQLFRLAVPSSGILTLEVIPSSPGEAEPRIGLFSSSCDERTQLDRDFMDGDFRYLAPAATTLVAEIRIPRIYYFHVGSADPAQRLGSYKIHVGFLTSFDDESSLALPSFFKTADGSSSPPVGDGPGESMQNEDDEEPSEEWEIDLPPALAPPEDFLVSVPCPYHVLRSFESSALWLNDEDDDFPDGLLCATALRLGPSVEIGGVLQNAWGDDADTFSFVLSRLRTVVIETLGDTDTAGGLYNSLGQRLAADDDGGRGDNLRIVRNLPRGRYFVRVAGADAAEGPYRLKIVTLDW